MQMAEEHHIISCAAVAWQEGPVWVVQGIDYDIVAHADDVLAIPEAFNRAIMENVCISVHLGMQPLENVGPGPEEFRKVFERAKKTVGLLRPPNIDQPPPPLIEIRVAENV
jgi:hypothetical protein